MAGAYIKLFVDCLETMEPLTEAERGSLVTALLEYRKCGTIPQLTGNERFLFPAFKAQIDRDAVRYEAICEKNRESARRSHANATERYRTVADATERSQDKDKDKDKDKDVIVAPHKFVKPTLEEITAYSGTRNVRIDASRFFDYYESKGWLVGKAPMKDWKAAVRNWERNNGTVSTGVPQQNKPGVTHQYGLGTGG